jgi:hypothetical protein
MVLQQCAVTTQPGHGGGCRLHFYILSKTKSNTSLYGLCVKPKQIRTHFRIVCAHWRFCKTSARLCHTVTALRYEQVALELLTNVRTSYHYSKAHVFKQAQHETCGLPNTIALC